MLTESKITSSKNDEPEQDLSVDDLKKKEYLRYGEQYKALLVPNYSAGFEPDRRVEEKLNLGEKIPEDWYEEIHSFSKKLVNLIPESCFEAQHLPFNSSQLSALLAETYNNYSVQASGKEKTAARFLL